MYICKNMHMCTEFSKYKNYTKISLQVQMNIDSCGLVRVVSVLLVSFIFALKKCSYYNCAVAMASHPPIKVFNVSPV